MPYKEHEILHRFSTSTDVEDDDVSVVGEAHNFMGFRSDAERENSLVQQHDVDSADLTTANLIANETIRISGAAVEVFLRTDNADYDKVWDEDPDPTYWPPIQQKGFFAPKSLEVALKQWGADGPAKLELFFALEDVKARFGIRSLRPGDVIRVPFGAIGNARPRFFRIINASADGNYRYFWLYLKCTMESLTGDITVQPESWSGLVLGDHQDE